MSDPYARVASLYDPLLEPFNAGLRALGLKLWPATPGARVLDLGCGTGTHLGLYLERGCQVTGIDSSPAMLHQARQKLGRRATLVLGDSGSCPFADRSFDLVLCCMALHEMDPDVRDAALQEARRLLRPGGRVLLMEHHPGPRQGLRGRVAGGLLLLLERLAGGRHYRNYRGFMAAGGVTPLVKRPGLRLEQQRIVNGGNIGLYLCGSN